MFNVFEKFKPRVNSPSVWIGLLKQDFDTELFNLISSVAIVLILFFMCA